MQRNKCQQKRFCNFDTRETYFTELFIGVDCSIENYFKRIADVNVTPKRKNPVYYLHIYKNK